ncbi:MAG: Lrp/AsnC family transcriptional regulator [Actinomycetota bacterium]|nr:Lrp/AsnC family transcriptional regulator [Actinomycetota bacterium]
MSRSAPQAPKLKISVRKDGTAMDLDDVDKRLMSSLQAGLPLVREPFARVAGNTGITLTETLERTNRLVNNRIIREITPIFDARALGYSSTLVVAKVDSENPQRAAAVVNAHPGVSHNYLQDHDFNLWFTIAIPRDSGLGLEGTLEKLMDETGAESMHPLPALTLFRSDQDLEADPGNEAFPDQAGAQPLDDLDIATVRTMQGPLDAIPRPFDYAAGEVGMPVDDFLAHLEGMTRRRLLRQVAAIPSHPEAASSARGTGLWMVPEADLPDVRRRVTSDPRVSLCHQSPVYEDWPHSVITVVHGRSKEDCRSILDSVADDCGIGAGKRSALHSPTDFKKVRLRFFTDDYRLWEESHRT